jgi:hypothetical protein
MEESKVMEKNKYEILKSKQVWEGHIFKVRVDDVLMPDGEVAEREVISHAGAVGVVPITTDGQVILVRQYRRESATGSNRPLNAPKGNLKKRRGRNLPTCSS